MFTGLIEKRAKIIKREDDEKGGKLHLLTDSPFLDLKRGESIAVNGVCLTLEFFDGCSIIFHVLEESLKKSNLGQLSIGDRVNLERALALGDRLGGHIVSGHVDTVSTVKKWTAVGDDWELEIILPEELKPFVIKKGSITIDGVSLTVVKLDSDSFTVHLIPTTLDDTTLLDRKEGALVNLEGDTIGKYVAKQLSVWKDNGSSNVTLESLANAGF